MSGIRSSHTVKQHWSSPVKSPRSSEGSVQGIHAIGGSNDHDPSSGIQPIHKRQQC